MPTMRARQRKKRKRTILVPLASMGDIAFLLIVFFILASNFTKERLTLELPDAPDIEDLQTTQISVAIDENGDYFVNGNPRSSAEAVQYEVASLLELRLRSANEQATRRGYDEAQTTALVDKAKRVQFKCDEAVRMDKYQPVITAIVEAGGVVAALGDREGEE